MKQFLAPVLLFLVSGQLTALDVSYKENGKMTVVKGEKTSKTEYTFNKGAKRKVTITTLDWAPYIGAKICKQGWVQQLTVALLASKGYEVKSQFLPWARTIVNAETGKAAILYPEYFIDKDAPSDVHKGSKRLDHLVLSKKFPGGPIAFMARKGYRGKFKGDLKALKGEKIGVVRGYQNTPDFDKLMDEGFFNISQATDDYMNVKKLLGGRINYIIGDPSVIRYSVANTASLNKSKKSEMLAGIETVKPVLQYNHLYYAVSKKASNWETVLRDVNDALAEFEKSGEIARIISATEKDCSNI